MSSLEIILPGNQPDFRAPPPSPIGDQANRKSLFVNEDELTEFLEHSLQVPDLILPDRIFPREISLQNPPEIDFNSLNSSTQLDTKILDSIPVIGCFQLMNHGISNDLIKSVLNSSVGVFGISHENKSILSKNLRKNYGFEEFSGDDEMETSEEFVWCRDDGLKTLMEVIWSDGGYSNFSEKLESLSTEIEKIATKIIRVLSESNNLTKKFNKNENDQVINREEEKVDGLVCCMYKHCRNFNNNRAVRLCESSLRSDVIRMLVKGSEYSHALGIHVFDGSSSEFHLYSKKGWVSFCPNRDAIVVTIGDQIQAWSGGYYKHVIGKPFFNEETENNVSMAFHYSPSTTPIITSRNFQGITETKTISLRQQFTLAIVFTFVYYFILNIF